MICEALERAIRHLDLAHVDSENDRAANSRMHIEIARKLVRGYITEAEDELADLRFERETRD